MPGYLGSWLPGLAWAVDCDSVWKTEEDAESCCPHVEDIGDSCSTTCTACDGNGFPYSLDPTEQCQACRGTGVAYKSILNAVLKQRRCERHARHPNEPRHG